MSRITAIINYGGHYEVILGLGSLSYMPHKKSANRAGPPHSLICESCWPSLKKLTSANIPSSSGITGWLWLLALRLDMDVDARVLECKFIGSAT